jgi:hypothetical protein
MSKYTSFVAVEERRRADGDPTRVDVPVELPDGMSAGAYEFVGETAMEGDYEDIGLDGAAAGVSYASLGGSYRYAPDRAWRASLSLGAGVDTAGERGGFLSLSGGAELRFTARNAIGVTATVVDRDEHARMMTLLGTLARWAMFGAFDLRLGAGAALVPGGDDGFAWQLRLAVPVPLGTKVHPEVELRIDRAHVGEEEDFFGIGGGIGLRF